MVTYMGINHLALVTSDMTATVRFWRDLLGMRLVAGLGRNGYRQYFIKISATDMLAFFEWPKAEPLQEKDHGVPVHGPVGFDHVAIGVGSDEDLWELKNRLAAADIWVSEVIDHGFIHSLYSFDPNNIPIEFCAPVEAVDFDRRPQMRDKEPLPIALEGSNPQEGTWPQPQGPLPDDERLIFPGEGVVFSRQTGESNY
jgi:catechol 2,3-dioxygenase-like lactoylglutathione lyase family enzyme